MLGIMSIQIRYTHLPAFSYFFTKMNPLGQTWLKKKMRCRVQDSHSVFLNVFFAPYKTHL